MNGDNRHEALASGSSLVNCGHFVGGKGAVVERDFIERTLKLVVPRGLAGGAKEEGLGTVILGEAHGALSLELSIDIKLEEIGPAHTGNVIPNIGADETGPLNVN